MGFHLFEVVLDNGRDLSEILVWLVALIPSQMRLSMEKRGKGIHIYSTETTGSARNEWKLKRRRGRDGVVIEWEYIGASERLIRFSFLRQRDTNLLGHVLLFIHHMPYGRCCCWSYIQERMNESRRERSDVWGRVSRSMGLICRRAVYPEGNTGTILGVVDGLGRQGQIKACYSPVGTIHCI